LWTICSASFVDYPPGLFTTNIVGVYPSGYRFVCPPKDEFIVSRDNDLLTLAIYQGIPILKATEALQRIEALK